MKRVFARVVLALLLAGAVVALATFRMDPAFSLLWPLLGGGPGQQPVGMLVLDALLLTVVFAGSLLALVWLCIAAFGDPDHDPREDRHA